jgi:hypothetical protein
VAVGVLAAALLGGCGLRQRVKPAIEQPDPGWVAPTAVDVENFYGSVRVLVDPSVKTATPVASVRTSRRVPWALRARAREAVKVQARTIEQDGRNILKVRTSTKWQDTSEVWVNLTIRMPRCDGARVWNRGGRVEIAGVSGALLVDNGELHGYDGDIEVRTASPMTDPVALITTQGTVVYQVAANSSGDFELSTQDGKTEFASGVIQPDFVHTDGKVFTARVNGGGNPVRLMSGKGLVRAELMHHPEQYTNKWQ